MARVRTDIVGVLVFRRHAGDVEFLQLRRSDAPGVRAAGTWQPVMGKARAGETSAAAAQRELAEETGLRRGDPAWLGLWALARVRPFYIASEDAVCLMPMFAVEVAPGWRPMLNEEHTDSRWVPAGRVGELFVWPDQAEACREVVEWLLRPRAACEALLRLA